jgi:hypothetical protein
MDDETAVANQIKSRTSDRGTRGWIESDQPRGETPARWTTLLILAARRMGEIRSFVRLRFAKSRSNRAQIMSILGLFRPNVAKRCRWNVRNPHDRPASSDYAEYVRMFRAETSHEVA